MVIGMFTYWCSPMDGTAPFRFQSETPLRPTQVLTDERGTEWVVESPAEVLENPSTDVINIEVKNMPDIT